MRGGETERDFVLLCSENSLLSSGRLCISIGHRDRVTTDDSLGKLAEGVKWRGASGSILTKKVVHGCKGKSLWKIQARRPSENIQRT